MKKLTACETYYTVQVKPPDDLRLSSSSSGTTSGWLLIGGPDPVGQPLGSPDSFGQCQTVYQDL